MSKLIEDVNAKCAEAMDKALKDGEAGVPFPEIKAELLNAITEQQKRLVAEFNRVVLENTVQTVSLEDIAEELEIKKQ
jgi:DNA-directed RNA polymerase specialized sigma24 family protein